ncbi:MAG TPA: RHS repeat-associated core domain-containing protein [Kineosporiaceae bacterium]|nr:RHS repeat-associated core domain-containing protein [Kineosporiaceae bacterium]
MPTSAKIPQASALINDGTYLYWLDNCGSGAPVRRMSLATNAVSTLVNPISGVTFRSLTVGPDGGIYTGTSVGSVLRIDPVSRAVTTVASSLPNVGLGAVAVNSLTADGTSLWAIATGTCATGGGQCEAIFSVDPTTGTATVLAGSVMGTWRGVAPGVALVSAGDYLYDYAKDYYQLNGVDVLREGLGRWKKSTGEFSWVFGMRAGPVFSGVSPLGQDYNFGLDVAGGSLYMAAPYQKRVLKLTPAGPIGPAGMEGAGGYNCAQITGCTPSAGDPVDLASGDLFEAANDLTVPGRGPALSFTRTYDTRRAGTAGRLGYGWTDNYDWRLSTDTNSSSATYGQVTIQQGNGAQTQFFPDGLGGYQAPSRSLATLTHNADGTWTYVIRRTATYTFNSSGLLTAIKDLNGYTTTLTYSGSQLTKATDPAGRTLTFGYDANGRIHTITDPLPRTVTYTYDTNGNLTGVVDADGRTWTLGYDSAHRLTTMTDPRGNSVTTVYDATSGKVTSQTDRRGKTTTFAYSAPAADGSTTTTVTHPAGNVDTSTFLNALLLQEVRGAGTAAATTWTYTYDPVTSGRTSATDGLGHTSTATYDANGNKLTVTDALGRTTTSTYNAFNQALTVTDPSGVATTYTYDTHGNPLTVSRPLTGTASVATTTYAYGDAAHPGDVTSTTDPRGKTTTYTYDSYGAAATVTDPTGRKTTTNHNVIGWTTSVVAPAGNATGGNPAAHTITYADFTGFGRPKTVTDALGHVTRYVYDADQNLTDVTDPANRHTSTTYNQANQPTVVTRPDTTTIASSYDDNGRLVTSTDALNHATTYAYDAADRTVSVTDPLGHTTSYGYDAAGRRTSVTDPGGHTTGYGYDNAGQATTVTDARGKITTTGYDSLGRPATVTDPDGHTTVTVYDSLGRRTRQDQGTSQPLTTTGTWTYDLAGNLLTDTDGNNHTTSYGYDDAGRRTSTTDPLNQATTISYDPDGNPADTTRPDGTTATRTWDAGGHLTGITYPAGTPSVTYTYDPAGQRSGMTDGTGDTSYTYDALGRLTSTQHTPAGGGTATTVAYTWDAAGRLTGITYPGNQTLTRGYDNADRLTTVSDWANRTLTYAWAANNTLTSVAYPNGVTTSNTYDATNNLTATTAATGSGTVLDLAYGYDNAGLLTSDTDQTNPANPLTRTYTHDPLARVNTVTGGASPGTYTHDPAGQLTTAGASTQAFDAAGQLTSSGTPAAPTTYTYNTLGQRAIATTTPTGGNPLTTSYTYDAAGRLTTAIPPGGASDTYTYDGDGLRAAAAHTTGTTDTFLWDVAGNLPLLLQDTTNTYLYGLGSSPYAQINRTTGAITYLHADNLGSTRTTTDTTGATTSTWTYDLYGNTTNHTGTTSTPFLYAGQYRDATTGLYYLRARYYDPTTAQFLTRDPLQPLTRQPYSYTSGNPLQHGDPTGLVDGATCTWWLLQCGGVGEDLANSTATVFVNIGRGASFGLTDQIADSISPGASCTVDSTSFQARFSQGLGAVGGILVTGLPGGAARLEEAAAANAGEDAARFVVDSAGNVTLRAQGPSGWMTVSEHAAQRLTERGISIDALDATLRQPSFRYWHEGAWKTGYYDPATKVFVGTVNDTVTTVIGRASQNYINNLKSVTP